LITDYVLSQGVDYDENYYYPNTSKAEALAFRRALKQQKVFYARIMQGLQQVYPDPRGYYSRKVLRICHLPPGGICSKIVGLTYDMVQRHAKSVASMSDPKVII